MGRSAKSEAIAGRTPKRTRPVPLCAILAWSELTGESGRLFQRALTQVSAQTMAEQRVEGEAERGRERGREREGEREERKRKTRGWLRECTKPFLSRGNRGMLCALRHRQAALCAVHAMRIDCPGPYESGYTTSGRRFLLLSVSTLSLSLFSSFGHGSLF